MVSEDESVTEVREPAIDWEEFRRTGFNPVPPTAMQIETSSICNFRCPSCPLSAKDYDRPEKHMSLDELRRVLDAFPSVERIELQGLGEVFLNPAIHDIIREAASRGIRVQTFSNASKIDRDFAFEIVRSGLDLVNFSMDGADEETFRTLRKGGTLARFRRCLTNLMEARTRPRSPRTPTIGLMTVLSKRNYRQMPKMLAMAQAFGVDSIIFTKINAGPWSDQTPVLARRGGAHVAARAGRRDIAPPWTAAPEVVWAFEDWTFQERTECYWPRQMTYVSVEGDVTPCCNFYDSRELNFGNVFREHGDDIWNNESYKAFRRGLMAGELTERCKHC